MTTLQNEDVGRKSSVYNQTGQNYFEQLSAYNRMSSHLRRTLLAQSVVDSRNKKYMREKRLSSRSSSCSKSLDQILARSEIFDEIAYDTERNPLDLLRMSLGCDPECRQFNNKKQISEKINANCSNAQCPSGSPKTARRRIEGSSEILRRSRTSNDGSIVKSNRRSPCGSARSCGFTGRRSDRQSEIDCDRRRIGDECRTRNCRRGNRVAEDTNESYNYDSSFESSSDTSEIDSPMGKKNECSTPCMSRARSIDRAGIELGRQIKELSNNVERIEESKYAKFLYDITQEIMLNGLYTDKELQEIFKKHVEMNSDSLDRDKMLSEICQLKISLNVKEFSDEEDEEYDIERFLGSGKFASFSPKKPPTPPKILDDNKLAERLKNHVESCRFDESRIREKNTRCGKNTVVLIDANPEILITECDLLVTLMEMKLEPRQIRTICKSLQNKSRETGLTHTVQVDAEESSYPRRKIDCGNSPIINEIKTERSTNEKFRCMKLSRFTTISTRCNETTGTSSLRVRSCQPNCCEDKKRLRSCACQCREEKKICSRTCCPSAKETREKKLPIKVMESQGDDEKPEIGVQTSRVVSQTRGITTSPSLERINGVTTGTRSRSSESRRMPEISRTMIKPNDDWRMKNVPPGETPRAAEGSKNRRTSSSQSDNDEQNENIENGDNEKTKEKQRSRIVEQSVARNSWSDESEALPVLKFKTRIVENEDKIDEIPKTSEIKIKEPRRSVISPAEKLTIDYENSTNSIVYRESVNPDRTPERLRNDSMRVDVNISEESDATISDIAADEDSPVPPDDERIHEITDDESASLPEDISQVDESRIVDETSMTDLEIDEKSRVPTTEEVFEKFKSIAVRNSDPKKLHIVDESEEGDISSATNSDQDFPEQSKINYSDEFERLAMLRRMKENSKHNEIVNDKNKGLTDSSQHDDDPSISEELEHPKKVDSVDKINDPGSNDDVNRTKTRSVDLKKKKQTVDGKNSIKEKRDKQTRVPRKPIERSRRKRPMIEDICNESLSERRLRIRPVEAVSPGVRKKHEQASSKGRKKRDLICSPCFGKLIGRSMNRSDSTISLEIPRSFVIEEKERKRTSFRDESMTTASDISLLNKEYFDDSSVQPSYENALRADDKIHDDTNIKNERVIISPRRLYADNEIILEEKEPSNELSGSRRDTIHRRTSLIRSLRITIENLKKRRSTNGEVSTNFREIPVLPVVTSETTILPKYQDNLSETRIKSLESKNSFKNISYAEISTETKESQPLSTIQREKASKITFIDASTWTTVDTDLSRIKNPQVTSTMNKCRQDCRGYRRGLDQMHLYPSSSDSTERKFADSPF